jgi:hypothetical protein
MPVKRAKRSRLVQQSEGLPLQTRADMQLAALGAQLPNLGRIHLSMPGRTCAGVHSGPANAKVARPLYPAWRMGGHRPRVVPTRSLAACLGETCGQRAHGQHQHQLGIQDGAHTQAGAQTSTDTWPNRRPSFLQAQAPGFRLPHSQPGDHSAARYSDSLSCFSPQKGMPMVKTTSCWRSQQSGASMPTRCATTLTQPAHAC